MKELIAHQRAFYRSHQSKDVRYRKAALQRLRRLLKEREKDIHRALYQDLHKAEMESYMSETGMVLSELDYQLRHLDAWSKPQRVSTPLTQFYAHSYRYPEPYGVVLVIAPWNYPFQLSMEPAIGAIAAGNTVIIKPSAYAPATSQIIAELIAACFPEAYVAVVQGGRKENGELLEQRFDYIFFTGGILVGKQVMEKASRYLTPVSLELGGKSPCIIEKSAHVKLAAKRIVFGKFMNAGQTCVAPDYVLIDASIKNEFLAYLKHYIQEFFGASPLANPDYPKIINAKHFQRLCALMEVGDICIGGQTNDNEQIEPTVMEGICSEDPIMQEEIFGPILPILTYRDIEEVFEYLQDHEKPLALYLFTASSKIQKRVLKECSFGGGCINDTLIHLATSNMGFGGVGQSGMGSYHGYDSFRTFSHYKSVVYKANWIDLPFRYHPYTKTKAKLLHKLMK